MAQQWTPPSAATPGGEPPPNYLIPAILSIFCCTPLAVVAIIFATQVNSKYQAGDLAGAQEASKKAKMWMMISAGVGLVGWIIIIILNVLGAVATNM